MEGANITERNKREKDSTPVDNCCPICFDAFNIAFKTNCWHWYCGGCILWHWKYSAGAIRRCQCPIRLKPISKLIPEASLYLRQEEEEVIEVLKNVQDYNCLFIGGALRLHSVGLGSYPWLDSETASVAIVHEEILSRTVGS